jgi:hypothetical protein
MAREKELKILGWTDEEIEQVVQFEEQGMNMGVVPQAGGVAPSPEEPVLNKPMTK